MWCMYMKIELRAALDGPQGGLRSITVDLFATESVAKRAAKEGSSKWRPLLTPLGDLSFVKR